MFYVETYRLHTKVFTKAIPFKVPIHTKDWIGKYKMERRKRPRVIKLEHYSRMN